MLIAVRSEWVTESTWPFPIRELEYEHHAHVGRGSPPLCCRTALVFAQQNEPGMEQGRDARP